MNLAINISCNLALKVAHSTAAICLLSAMPSMADELNNANSQPINISAKQVSNKHFYSISYLKNINKFQLLSNEDIDVVTLEYSGKYTWGDSFVFFDRVVAAADELSPRKQKNYLEASARLSIPFLFGQPTLSQSIKNTFSHGNYVKDYFIAGMVEYSYLNVKNRLDELNISLESSSTITNSLLGLGIAWESDFFTYLNTNFYYAINEKQGNDYQLTLSFAKSFDIAGLAFKTNGYIDYSSATSDHKTSFHFSPKVLLDLGKVFNQPKLFYVGIKYSYWRNKYGLANIDDEHTVSAMVKLSF